MNLEKLLTVSAEVLKADEGLRLRPYTCTGGALTIGYGHNLDARGIPLGVADLLFELDLRGALAGAAMVCPTFGQLSQARQVVLVSMAFQLGTAGLGSFKRFLASVQAQAWDRAADELLDSLAARQTPQRWARHAEMMRKG